MLSNRKRALNIFVLSHKIYITFFEIKQVQICQTNARLYYQVKALESLNVLYLGKIEILIERSQFVLSNLQHVLVLYLCE